MAAPSREAKVEVKEELDWPDRLTFCAWNTQGWSRKKKAVMRQVAEHQIDVAVLTETKKPNYGCEDEKKYGYIHLFSGVCSRFFAKGGVSILIREEIKSSLESCDFINERILIIRMFFRGHRLHVIGIYGPIEGNSDKDQFVSDLRRILSEVCQHGDVILLGDFNARVGKSDTSQTVGPYGEDNVNNNGKLLINVCHDYNLRILNGFYPQNKNYTHKDRICESIIDYGIINTSSALCVENLIIFDTFDCGTSHRLLKLVIKFPKIEQPAEDSTDVSKNNILDISFDSIGKIMKFRASFKRHIQQLESVDGSNKGLYRRITESFKFSLDNISTGNIRPTIVKDCWSNKIFGLKIEADELLKKFVNYEMDDDRKIRTQKRFVKKYKEFQTAEIKGKESFWKNMCVVLERMKGFEKFKLALDVTLPNRIEADYLFDLCAFTENFAHQVDDDIIRPEEVQEVAFRLKEFNAIPSFSKCHIWPQLVMYAGAPAFNLLAELFSSIFRNGLQPTFHINRDSVTDCTIEAIYVNILNRRLVLDAKSQGFFDDRCSSDRDIFVLRQLIEKQISQNQCVYIATLNTKCLYRIEFVNRICDILKECDINENILSAVKMFHTNHAYLGEWGKYCTLRTIVRIYHTYQMKKLTEREANAESTEISQYYLFTSTENQLLVGLNKDILVETLTKLKGLYKLIGAEMNSFLPRCLIVGGKEEDDLALNNGIQIISVPEVTFSGAKFVRAPTCEDDIDYKLGLAYEAVETIRDVLVSDTVSKATKRKIFNSVLKTICSHSSVSWILTKQYQMKLLAFETKYWALCLQIKQIRKLNYENLAQRMAVKSNVLENISQEQKEWLIFVTSMPDESPAKHVMLWCPAVKKRGRRKKGWLDFLNAS